MVRIVKKSSTEVAREDFDGFSFVPLLGKDGWN
jgi:protein-L-isoaspartate(D-aspartate) O-methyltransferase